MNGFKASDRGSQFIVAWRQVAKLESTRSIRLPLSNDGAANVHGDVHKRAARLVEYRSRERPGRLRKSRTRRCRNREEGCEKQKHERLSSHWA